MGLTPRQARVLDYLRTHTKMYDYAPKFEDIMRVCDMASKSNVHRVLKCLEERGHIRRLFGRARAIEVVDDALEDLESKSLRELRAIRDRCNDLMLRRMAA